MIYFIKQENYVKIGFTNRFKARLNDLQVGSPVKLEVLAIIEGDKKDEYTLHQKFNHICSNGEWFMYCDELKSFIDSLDNHLMWKYGFINEYNSPIGLIKQTRLELNLSMEELADKLNITKQGVLDMEKRDMQGRITIGVLSKTLSAMNYKLGVRAIKENI
jgi:DNA-binding XRE family transcriptional regulator